MAGDIFKDVIAIRVHKHSLAIDERLCADEGEVQNTELVKKFVFLKHPICTRYVMNVGGLYFCLIC